MRSAVVTGGLLALMIAGLVLTTKVRVVGAGDAPVMTRAAGEARQPVSLLTQPRGLAGRSMENGAEMIAAPLLALPVPAVDPARITDSWGDPRENGLRAHHGTDIMAPFGTPVVAAAPGTVEKLHQSAAGGITAYVRSPDRQWSYYYAHLGGYAPDLREGQVLRAGDPIGYVGDTGNAGAGNYHLHFGLSLMSPRDAWSQGRPVDPYPSLAGKRTPG